MEAGGGTPPGFGLDPGARRGEQKAAAGLRRAARGGAPQEPLAGPLLKAAGVFAALAVVCGGLLGLNAANPALAESIPGLGSLFALMNDHTMHPMGSHVGTYVDHVEELDLTADAPADTDYELTLDEAFCDGSYVYLTPAGGRPRRRRSGTRA